MINQSLINAIQQLNLSSQTAANIVTAFSTTVNGPPNSTPYTWAGLCQQLLLNGVSSSIVVNARATISGLANGGPTLDGALLSGGFDCSNAANRALLIASEVTDPPAAVTIINAMLAIGIPQIPQWQASGLAAAPSLTDVESALTVIANPPAPPTYNTHGIRLAINQGATTCFSIVVNQASNSSGWIDGPNVVTFGTGDLVNATLTPAQQSLATAINNALAAFIATL